MGPFLLWGRARLLLCSGPLFLIEEFLVTQKRNGGTPSIFELSFFQKFCLAIRQGVSGGQLPDVLGLI